MPNPFVHVELQTKDIARAKDFYGRLFDWKLEDIPLPGGEGSYTMIQVGEIGKAGGAGGGMYPNPDPNVPSAWVAYVGVDDIGAATAQARELGAQILVDGVEVGPYGWMTVFMDPTGAVLAMWQAKPGSM